MKYHLYIFLGKKFRAKIAKETQLSWALFKKFVIPPSWQTVTETIIRVYYGNWKYYANIMEIISATYWQRHNCNLSQVSDHVQPFERPRPANYTTFPAHNPEKTPTFDPWWLRWDEFAEKLKWFFMNFCQFWWIRYSDNWKLP